MKILKSNGFNATENENHFVYETRSILSYIKNVSEIAAFLGEVILFNSNFSYTSEEFDQVMNIVDIINGRSVYSKKQITSNISCHIVADENFMNIERINSMIEPSNIMVIENKNEIINCFGKKLKLPPKSIAINQVIPKIIFPQSTYKQGDIIEVEWIPSDKFQCKIEYISNPIQ